MRETKKVIGVQVFVTVKNAGFEKVLGVIRKQKNGVYARTLAMLCRNVFHLQLSVLELAHFFLSSLTDCCLAKQ